MEEQGDYSRILVPLDGSELAERILPHVEKLARKFGATVILLQVTASAEMALTDATSAAGIVPGVGTIPVAVPTLDPFSRAEAERREASEYLEGVARRLRVQGLNVEWECQTGPAAAVIVQRARQLGVELMALTTHGRGGLGRLVFGSVADTVLRTAPCPVLLVRVA